MDKLGEIFEEAKHKFANAKTLQELDAFKSRYLGRKSSLNQLLRSLEQFSIEERRKIGPFANEIKNKLTEQFNLSRDRLRRKSSQPKDPYLDLTLPSYPVGFGGLHPLRIVANKILDVFKRLGFIYVESPEIETDFNNFTYLNIPEDHPARDMWDTLYLKMPNAECRMPNARMTNSEEKNARWLLRTHTTPAQIHLMQSVPPPYRAVTLGKVFRREAIDATHLPIFHQIDAFYVDSCVSMADLKNTLEIWAKELFGSTAVRFRPSYFPFTEPSCEVEVQCFLCKGQGCSTCKNGWIEMLGAGMIHANVLEMQGHDPNKWKGFAFGLGVERVAMVVWGIPDIRLFYENDLNFLGSSFEISSRGGPAFW